MLSVVCWKWGTLYSAEHVNRLHHMLARHLHMPHLLWCMTDDREGIDPDVRVLPIPFTTLSPDFMKLGRNFRKLWTYGIGRRGQYLFGPRTLLLDLDVVFVDDITPLFNRSEPLVLYDQDPTRRKYNTSMVLMDTGVLERMWSEFSADPVGAWNRVRMVSGFGLDGSDQVVVSHYATPRHSATWTAADGVVPAYLVRNNDGGGLPPGTRAVLFFGCGQDMNDPKVQKRCPWILENWR